ncbi:OmpA family protein [Microvirga lotononidis]|uniref:OmpA family protein n=1 Tax=Microvirga lotononidis TaxID=864069 RepID=UPI001FDA0BE8|nr:OmpA family protein [Microvirga lotononidis]WQO27077.1 OmpA family protein [Microvirga lotononidis]
MKLSRLFLASTALPLLLLPMHVSALPSEPVKPLVLAQAGPDTDEELPPGARQRRQGPDGERGGRPGQERRQGGPDQGAPGAPEERGQRPPRGAGPGGPRPGEEPGAQRPRREPGPPAERPAPPAEAAPPRPAQAPAERPQPPAERPQAPVEAPTRPQRPAPQEREQAPAERPRPQPPAGQTRPATPPPAPQQAAPPAPQQAPNATPAERQRPGRSDNTENPDRTRGQRPEQPSAPSAPPAPPAPQPAPSAPPRAPVPPAPAPAPAAPAPAPRAQQPTPPAPGGQFQQVPGRSGFQQGAPSRAEPLDPSRVRIDDLRSQRRERREGDRVIIEEPGNRTIIREGNQVIIRHDETERFRQTYRDADIRTERRGADEEVTIVRRPDGSQIETVRDQDGNLIRRIRREPAGREVVLIENRRSGIDRRPGYGYVDEEVIRMPPPIVRIPREEYIVETERASEADIVRAFTAPPVERIDRAYTLDEVRRSQPLRERMRRVDVDTINFEFGSWDLPPDQIDSLRGIADGLRQAISRNPNEIFLVEGHTDAVGSDEDNLTLSDRRAETVATILTQRFQIPAENLTTQGYGEQYLKVNTQGPERENRRVTMRRITPLLQGQNQQ